MIEPAEPIAEQSSARRGPAPWSRHPTGAGMTLRITENVAVDFGLITITGGMPPPRDPDDDDEEDEEGDEDDREEDEPAVIREPDE
jgi:hypothetical protein